MVLRKFKAAWSPRSTPQCQLETTYQSRYYKLETSLLKTLFGQFDIGT